MVQGSRLIWLACGHDGAWLSNTSASFWDPLIAEGIEELFGGIAATAARNGTMKLVAVLLPVTRLRDPGQAVVEGRFDKPVLPVFECGFESIAEFIVG